MKIKIISSRDEIDLFPLPHSLVAFLLSLPSAERGNVNWRNRDVIVSGHKLLICTRFAV